MLTAEKLSELYLELAEPLPEEAIEESFASETKKGYNTVGYGCQYLINRMNEVLGPAHWRAIDEIVVKNIGSTQGGKPIYDITMKMTVKIGNPISKESDEGTVSYFDVIAEQSSYGGHISYGTLADALKGAHTNSLKKTLALFGVGRQAYEGIPPQGNKPKQQNKGYNQSGRNQQRPQGGQQQPNGSVVGFPQGQQPPQGGQRPNNHGQQNPPSQGGQRSNQGQPPQGGQRSNQGQPPQGGQQPGQGQPPQGGQPPGQGQPPQGGQRPNQGQPPQGGQRPNQGQPPQGGQQPNQGQPPQGGQQPGQGQPPKGGQQPGQGQPPQGGQQSNQGQPPQEGQQKQATP